MKQFFTKARSLLPDPRSRDRNRDGTEDLNRQMSTFHSSDPSAGTTVASPSTPHESHGGDRQRWGSRLKFVLAAVGSAVGLGNVWRFPYLVYKNGGGAFLLPFIICLVLVGDPLLFLELALGQQLQKGPLQSFGMVHRRLWGLGFASSFASYLIVIYYNVIISWIWLYFFASFQDPLPWDVEGMTAEKYFYEEQINASDSIEDVGAIQYKVCLTLILTWVVIYFCVWKDVHFLGKISVWTMPIPVVVLIILLIRGWSLDGGDIGMEYFWTPNVSELYKPEVWIDAMSQIFFSLSIAGGIMVSYGSYMPKEHNIVRETYTISLCDVGFSIFAGMTVFTVLGNMAHQKGVEIEDVVQAGPALVFIVFPDALRLLPAPQLFSILFFGMLLLLAIPTAFSLVVAFLTAIYDAYPTWRVHNHIVSGFVCLAGFLCSLLMTTRAGIHFLDIFDHYLSDYVLILVGFLEIVSVVWLYPIESLVMQVELNTHRRPPRVWIFLLTYISPIAIAVLFLYNLAIEFRDGYGDYPGWATFIGWLSVIISMSSLALSIWKPMNPDEVGRVMMTKDTDNPTETEISLD
eukprot:TRINITY_DN6158_c0_g1_i1.p1 TRINITY_DN6158_c0_g1~~TRINITY_DN6158_c0_g1_i1.p1  ORF type:complete len:574 (-),score=106.18 TRINITY_DN6158_c0_g1_i1:155-1876(-)